MQQQPPPCSSGEMQGLNSLLNNNSNNGHDQQQQLQSQIHHHQSAQFDPASQDDFLEQMLSSLPSCSWTDLKSPSSSSWVDLNPSSVASKQISGGAGGRDLSDETAPCSQHHQENVGFHQFDDQSMILASKMRQHQISGGGNSPTSVAAAAKLMLQQQLLMNGNGSVQALYNGFAGSLHGNGQSSTLPQHFHHAQGGAMQAQSYGAPGPVMNQAQGQPQASGSTGGGGGGSAPAQPKQRVRARRGQATDPHSIAERLRRERIAERMKALQELVPNANKTDKASMLDEIIDYVKFLQLQVKVLSMSRLGGAAAVAPLLADMSSEGGGDCIQANGRNPNGNQTASSNDSLTVTEHQVAKLMEEDMGSAMQYLQGKGLCLMPISLATAISTATCHTRNPLINNNHGNAHNPLLQPNGEGPSSPSMSVLTVQSATVGTNGVTDGSVKDAASVSKP